MSFTKLDSGIVDSSIWSEPLGTRILWITLLAKCDENGFVACSKTGLQRSANISEDEFSAGILTLESPDPDSRTPDNEGRRIAKIEGGWVVLNFPKYRSRIEVIKEQTRERVRNYRERHQKTKCNVTKTLCNATVTIPSASVSVSASDSVLISGKSENLFENREKKFREQVFGVTQYDRQMLEGFFNYWSEKDRLGKKMRFESERTWELTKRLATWYSRGTGGKNYGRGNQQSRKRYEFERESDTKYDHLPVA